MFTGLIESVGRVVAAAPNEAGFRLTIETPLDGEVAAGESLAVNGVCLTVVTAARGTGIGMDVSPETARITTLGDLRPGTSINLERSLRAGARLGGHFVQGHVDATGSVVGVRPTGESYWLTFSYPASLAPYIVLKGSIAVDGVSLTVAEVGERFFGVQVIPFTWQHTNVQGLVPGARVNLESDILGKYVVRALEVQQAGSVSQDPRIERV
jgi:riboflavin synthase